MSSASEAISPTAHYTGYVWARTGSRTPSSRPREGRLMYESVRLPMAAAGALGRPTLERYLLARHRAIDLLLERAIDDGGVTQVIEVAAGLSPRGWRFAAARPGARVHRGRPARDGRAQARRARADGVAVRSPAGRGARRAPPRGRTSISGVAGGLDHASGLAIITEGLLAYLPREAVDGAWRRFALALAALDRPLYLGHPARVGMTAEARAFRVLLGVFVRGEVRIHFETAADCDAALLAAGFHGSEHAPGD